MPSWGMNGDDFDDEDREALYRALDESIDEGRAGQHVTRRCLRVRFWHASEGTDHGRALRNKLTD